MILKTARTLAVTALAAVGLSLLAVTPANALPGSDPSRPAPNTPGWTYCWVSEANFGTVDQIEPYDAQTWPIYITPSQGQPGYQPHTGAASEGSAIWTSVARSDPRTVGTVGWDVRNTSCYPTPSLPTFEGRATILDEAGTSLGSATNSLSANGTWSGKPFKQQIAIEPNAPIQVQTIFNFTVPELEAVIGFDGVPTTNWYQGATEWRFLPPTVNSAAYSSTYPENITVTCDGADGVLTRGLTASVSCLTTGTTPDVVFEDWRIAAKDDFFTGFYVPMETRLPYESRYTNATSPTMNGPWGMAQDLTIDPPIYTVGAAAAWLPTAENKSFRVAVGDTLTVTPEGLLTGATWSQGNIDSLDTFITNVPSGGTLTPEGDLEFTSAEIGDFGFNYYLQDPDTELRSREAIGQIEVFADAVEPPVIIAPPVITDPPVAVVPPLVIDAPVLLLPPAPIATPPAPAAEPSAPVLASTGTDVAPALLLAGSLLAVGATALIVRRRKRKYSEASAAI